MNEFLKVLLSLSFSGTILIFTILLVRFLFKSLISRQWQYYIWLIVIARLLLPFAPETNLIKVILQNTNANYFLSDTIVEQNELNLQNEDFMSNDNLSNTENVKSNIKPNSILYLFIKNLWSIWLIVATILFIRKITIYQSFVKYIKAGRTDIDNIEILEQFGTILKQFRIKQHLCFSTNSLIYSPILIGLFRPCIVLPSLDISDLDFKYTMFHELTHYKRKDMLYKWLIQLALCLHWFNPFIYLMVAQINRDCELSCDEVVIKNLSSTQKVEYGNTLLNAVAIGGNFKSSICSLTLNESKILLKERLDAIMNFKRKSKFAIINTVILSIILCFGAMFTGMYTKQSNGAVIYIEQNSKQISTANIKDKKFYLVENEEDLRSIGSEKYPMSGYYMLNNDIELTKEWTPIGSVDNPFTGHFEGNGFSISGLKITDTDTQLQGTFGCAVNATIHNLTVVSPEFYEKFGGTIGGIVAWGENCKISDCKVVDAVVAKDDDINFYVVQVISDGQIIDIVYKIDAPKWITFTDNIRFEKVSYDIPDLIYSNEEILNQTENSREVHLQLKSSSKVAYRKLKLEFSNLGYYNKEQVFVSLLEGKWKLETNYN